MLYKKTILLVGLVLIQGLQAAEQLLTVQCYKGQVIDKKILQVKDGKPLLLTQEQCKPFQALYFMLSGEQESDLLVTIDLKDDLECSQKLFKLLLLCNQEVDSGVESYSPLLIESLKNLSNHELYLLIRTAQKLGMFSEVTNEDIAQSESPYWSHFLHALTVVFDQKNKMEDCLEGDQALLDAVTQLEKVDFEFVIPHPLSTVSFQKDLGTVHPEVAVTADKKWQVTIQNDSPAHVVELKDLEVARRGIDRLCMFTNKEKVLFTQTSLDGRWLLIVTRPVNSRTPTESWLVDLTVPLTDLHRKKQHSYNQGKKIISAGFHDLRAHFSVSLSPNGLFLIKLSDHNDHLIELLDLGRRGQPVFFEQMFEAPIHFAQISPNNRWLIVWLTNSIVYVQDLMNRDLPMQRFVSEHFVSYVAIDPKSEQLFISSYGKLRIITLADFSEIVINLYLTEEGFVNNVKKIECSFDGKWVVLLGNDKVKIVDRRTNSLVKTFKVNGAALAISPDSRWLAVTLNDADVLLYDLFWLSKKKIIKHGNKVVSVRFSDDSKMVIARTDYNRDYETNVYYEDLEPKQQYRAFSINKKKSLKRQYSEERERRVRPRNR